MGGGRGGLNREKRAGERLRSLAGLSCLGGGRGGLNREKRAGERLRSLAGLSCLGGARGGLNREKRAGERLRSLAGLSCLGGGGGGLNREKRAGAAFSWENWAPKGVIRLPVIDLTGKFSRFKVIYDSDTTFTAIVNYTITVFAQNFTWGVHFNN